MSWSSASIGSAESLAATVASLTRSGGHCGTLAQHSAWLTVDHVDCRHAVVRDFCDPRLRDAYIVLCGKPRSRMRPFWRLHLPSGGVFTIKLIGVEGPLVRFVGFWATASTVDYVLAAPQSVIITIESSDELAEPLEIELPNA
jgi:hypothetical protein